MQRADVVAQHKLEMLVEVSLHFHHPLGSNSFGNNNQNSPNQSAQFEFAHDQTGLDGLTQANLVGQQVTHALA